MLIPPFFRFPIKFATSWIGVCTISANNSIPVRTPVCLLWAVTSYNRTNRRVLGISILGSKIVPAPKSHINLETRETPACRCGVQNWASLTDNRKLCRKGSTPLFSKQSVLYRRIPAFSVPVPAARSVPVFSCTRACSPVPFPSLCTFPSFSGSPPSSQGVKLRCPS